jgi:hypothetical protein
MDTPRQYKPAIKIKTDFSELEKFILYLIKKAKRKNPINSHDKVTSQTKSARKR